MSRYHLWFVPSGRVHETLAETIATLSRLHHAPRFDPHVTLLGNLAGPESEIISKSSVLAAQLNPFDIQLTSPGFTDEYFRCVFLTVEKTPPLVEAHHRASILFEREAGPPYQPHLSLLYGRYPTRVKEQIAENLPGSVFGRFTADRLVLIRAGSEDPKDWINIQTVPFGSAT